MSFSDQVRIQLDDELSNPVEVAGPDRYELLKINPSPLEEVYQNVFKLRDQGKDQGKIEENNYFQEAEKNLMMAKYQIENMVKVLEMTLSKKELGMIQCPGNARLNKPVKASIVVQMKKNQQQEVANILSKGRKTCEDSIRMSRNYIGDLLELRNEWRILNPRPMSSWDRNLFVDCSISAHPLFSNEGAQKFFQIVPNSSPESENFGRAKISKTMVYARFGVSASESGKATDPCGAKECSEFLHLIQSHLLFKDIFQMLLTEASLASNPFCSVFGRKIVVDLPGLDMLTILEKQFPDAGFEISGLDLRKISAIESFAVSSFIDRKVSGIRTRNQTLLEELVCHIQYFKLCTKVLKVVSDFTFKHGITYKSSFSDSNLHMHVKVIGNQKLKVSNYRIFELKIDGIQMTIIRSSKEKPYGYSFAVHQLDQLELALLDFINDK